MTSRTTANQQATKQATKQAASAATGDDEAGGREWLENVIAITVVLAITFLGLAVYHGWFTPTPEPVTPSVNDQYFVMNENDDPLLGDVNAPTRIIAFNSYDCNACKAFYNGTFQELKAKYIDTGKACYIFRDFPLDASQPDARALAAAANCAGAQGKYWEYHDALYEHDGPWTSAFLNETASKLGLDLDAFNECRVAPETNVEITRDIADGVTKGGVTAVPTFFIRGSRVIGNQPFSVFDELLNESNW